jgi:hypothetical protein
MIKGIKETKEVYWKKLHVAGVVGIFSPFWYLIQSNITIITVIMFHNIKIIRKMNGYSLLASSYKIKQCISRKIVVTVDLLITQLWVSPHSTLDILIIFNKISVMWEASTNISFIKMLINNSSQVPENSGHL